LHIEFLLRLFNEYKAKVSIIWQDKKCSYSSLIEDVKKCRVLIEYYEVQPGSVVAINADFSPKSIALLFALVERTCIVVPLENTSTKNENGLFKIASVEFVFRIDEKDKLTCESGFHRSENEFYGVIRERQHPGLVLFSSGTSGEPKAAVHDLVPLMAKFKTKRKTFRTLNFLLFDHWGGLNTMFHILSNGGVLITTNDRNPTSVCELIEKHAIELLPVSPTFLNLMLLSGAYEDYDLSSLKIISYGTEPMPENTLKRLIKIFPGVRFLQTYGLIELGVMRSKSEKDDSLWFKVGGEGYKTRVVDGILQIRAESAMLGYLNSPSPFTDDGWFVTGDQVLQKGEYIKILGRKSEIILVGGEKVYPQEVENVICEMENVADVIVFGEKNRIMGNVVCAKVKLDSCEKEAEFSLRLKRYCTGKLHKYKVPVRVIISDRIDYGARFKKVRRD